jgi:hypothetical protein
MKLGRFGRGAAVAVGTWLACGAALADETRRSFVSCPMVRDTQSVPCWLAEYEGELYFLTLQTDVSAPVTPPWLGHKVLVEGKAAPDEPRICGGVVIKDVRLSVLPEIDTSCNTILPAEERYNLTFEPPRPPGPSGGRLAFDGARQGPPAAQRPEAAASTAVREFTVPYTFDGMVGFGHPRFLTPVIRHAVEVKARQIEIIGYRGAALLSNGQTLVEAEGIGRRRAQQIATIMKGSDLESPEFKVTWIDEPAPVTGEDDHLTRRVVIRVHAP